MNSQGPLVCPVLVGRDDVLALADRRRAEAAGGRGGLLFLAGEAGIGKTRLLGSIERRAAIAGFTVVRGGAFPRDVEVAGGVFLDLSRSLAGVPRLREAGVALEARLVRQEAVAPDGSGPDGDLHRRRRILVLDAVDLLAGIADGGPVHVSLEDLHWADDLTLEILAALARRLPDVRLQVAATYRSDELYPRVPMREWRARLLTGRLAEEVRVGRLDLEGTATMTSAIMGADVPAPHDLVASIHERSDGVPLHVEELLGVVRGTPSVDGSVRTVDVPETLEEAILRRAERLSTRARRVADAAAVIGRSFDLTLLAEVMERPADRLSAPLEELGREFFVTRTADAERLDFRHALIRDALYARVSAATRRRLHGRVADASAADPRFGPAFRSVHLEEAGRAGEAFAAALEGARRAAAVSAHREAVDLLERARRNAPAGLPRGERAALLAELAAESAATDANEAADRYYAAASGLYEAVGDPLAAMALVPARVAVRHLLGDDLAARAARLEAGIRALDELPDDAASRAVRARLLAGLSAANMLDRRLDASIALGEASRRLATASGNVPTELDVMATLGSCFVFAGRMDEGWAVLEEVVHRSRAARLEAQSARAYRMIGSSASVLVEYDLAERWLREGIDIAERAELWNDRHYMAAHLGHVLWATGRWQEAERVAGHALSDGRGGITTRITALHALGYVALGRGDLPRATELLAEARELGEGMAELQRLSPALWGLAEAALLAGDPAAAAEWCARGEAASARVADAAYLFPFLVTGARAHLAQGDVAAATAWVERGTALLAQRSIPGTLPAVDHAVGLVALARGSTGKARSSLEAARAGWLARRRAWEAGWAAVDLATVHARANRPADAHRLVDDARASALALGSGPLADAAAALARRLRGRAAVVPAWAPLTARELEVARGIADGLTNGQIAAALGIAPKTVTAHVEHILGKLGAARRTEVATWVATRGVAGGQPAPAGPGRALGPHGERA
jgi:DNA-binding CsgD family transcriptional regulator/tetratricopeptide (TPR) repeat protein